MKRVPRKKVMIEKGNSSLAERCTTKMRGIWQLRCLGSVGRPYMRYLNRGKDIKVRSK